MRICLFLDEDEELLRTEEASEIERLRVILEFARVDLASGILALRAVLLEPRLHFKINIISLSENCGRIQS